MEYCDVYGRSFQPYHFPFKRNYQPQVLLIQIPVTTPLSFLQNAQSKDIFSWKSNAQKKTKSKSQRLRDSLRRERFIANKSACAAMPFCELNDKEFRDALPNSLFSKEEMLERKLKAARNTVAKLVQCTKAAKTQNSSALTSVPDKQGLLESTTTESETPEVPYASSLMAIPTGDAEDSCSQRLWNTRRKLSRAQTMYRDLHQNTKRQTVKEDSSVREAFPFQELSDTEFEDALPQVPVSNDRPVQDWRNQEHRGSQILKNLSSAEQEKIDAHCKNILLELKRFSKMKSNF